MKTSALLLSLPLLLVGCGEGEAAPDESVPTIGDERALATVSTLFVSDVTRRIANRPDLILVDVRTAEEYADGHIEGSVNMPLDSFEPVALDGQEVILYCRSGRRSAEAATMLAAHRQEDVEHLEGGIIAWQEAGQPVVTE